MAKRILKGIGKYSVFLLLNGLGGVIVATIFTFAIAHNLAWILGQPKTGTAYGAIVEVISWGLWGLFGALVAVGLYPKIFKEFPPRWMGIVSISILAFGWILTTILGIVGGMALGEEIELGTWKDFVHETTAIVTFWYLFRLPPLLRYEYDRQVAA
jgi:hypothetical protein